MAQVFEFCEIETNDYNVISVQSEDVLDKGYICSISGLVDGEDEIYTVTAPDGNGSTPTEADLVMICGGEDYEDSTTGQRTGGVKDPRDITYAAGRTVLAQRVPVGRRFKLDQASIVTTDANPDVAIAAGVYLIPRDGEYTLATSATIPAGVGCVFIIERTGTFPIGSSYVSAVVARRVV